MVVYTFTLRDGVLTEYTYEISVQTKFSDSIDYSATCTYTDESDEDTSFQLIKKLNPTAVF